MFEKQNQSWQPLNWCHPCVKHSNPMLFSSRIDIFSFPTSLIEGGKKDRLHLGTWRWVLAQAKPFHGRLGPKSILQRKSCLKMNKIDTCRYTVWTIDKQFIWILVWNVLVIEKFFEIQDWRPRVCKIFEINRTIYSNSERSEQFLVTECFFNLFLEVSQI